MFSKKAEHIVVGTGNMPKLGSKTSMQLTPTIHKQYVCGYMRMSVASLPANSAGELWCALGCLAAW